MKVCLVNPPITISRKHANRPTPFFPMGLLYVAACLEKSHRVSVLDAPALGWRDPSTVSVDGEPRQYLGLSLADISEHLRRERPQVVGITVPFSISLWSALKVASLAKEVDPGIITVVGGHHPSVRPEDALSQPAVDYVVVGEGEETMPELLDSLERGGDLTEVRGIGYRKEGEPHFTPWRPPVADLDSLPLPARHLIPMEEYFAASEADLSYRGDYIPPKARWATVLTSWGCPFECVFCAIHLTMGRKWRQRSPEKVIDEVKYLVDTYGIQHVTFEDDNITLNKLRAKRLCSLMIKSKLGVTWSLPNGVRADTLDEELVRMMKESGCIHVFVAPESGDQFVVDKIMRKRMDLKAVEQAVVWFKKYGIAVDANSVIGVVGETKDNIAQSYRFARRLLHLGCGGVNATIAIPYFSTHLYQQAKAEGHLVREVDALHLDSTTPWIHTAQFTPQELLTWRGRFFLLNSWRGVLRMAWGNPKFMAGRLLSSGAWLSFLRELWARLARSPS